MFVSQRLGHEQVAIKPVGQTESSGDPKRQPNVDIAQRPTNPWAENKTKTERHADHAEGAGAFFFRRYVCDVGHRCWNTRRGDSGNDASEEEPADRRRERHYDIVQTETEVR